MNTKVKYHAETALGAIGNLVIIAGTVFHLFLAIREPMRKRMETNNILQSLDLFKKYTDNFILQFLLQGKGKGYRHLLKTYSNETNTWEMPLDEILSIIQIHATKK